MTISVNDGLKRLLDLLNTTIPGSANTLEWASIRSTCTILRPFLDSGDGNDQMVLEGLLRNLRTITPGSANTVEWARIRAECASIVRDLT